MQSQFFFHSQLPSVVHVCSTTGSSCQSTWWDTLSITIVHLNVMLTWFHMQMNDLWVWHTHVYVCARETCDRTCYELHLLYVSRSLVHLFTSTAKF